MRKTFLSLLLLSGYVCLAQAPTNDDACNATILTVTNTCSYVTATNVNATTSPEPDPGCGNYAGGDVWFQAVVPTSGILKVTTQAGTDLNNGAMAFYTGTCGALTQIACDRNSSPSSGSMPEITASGLTPGVTIWIRFWEDNNNDFGTFELCATTLQPPNNDEPCNAIELTPSATCAFTTGTNVNATATAGIAAPSCDNYVGGDVWYKTTAPANGILHFTTEASTDLTNGAMAIYRGNCSSLTEISCDDNSGTGSMPDIQASGLTPGETIWIRFWESGNNDFGTFGICVTTVTSPDNDEPCNATLLNINSTCTNTLGNNVNATPSAGVPDPVCGNYAGGDVWYKTVVPANGHIYVISSAGTLTNGSIALYQGTCSTLNLIACENTQGPGEWGEMSFVGLTPGDTIWIRVWDENNNDVGDFNICVTSNPIAASPVCNINTAAGATCATATSICSLDGYCGNTISYAANFWPEMLTTFRSCLGNNNANIQNNSFLKFTAASTSAQFKVWVTSTTKGIGIQMMFFEAATCGSGSVICHGGYDDIRPGPEKLITATGLTPGNTYYLMVDGVSNDLCNYVIGAVSGLSALSVSSAASAICNGNPITLTAGGITDPGTVFTWNWTNAGGVAQTNTGVSLTDIPTQTTTYTVTASGIGVCPQIRTITITVNDNPSVVLNNPIVCSGTTATLTALPAPAATYSYNWTVPSGATNPGNQSTCNSSTAGNYAVVVTNTATGCFSPAGTGSVTLLPLPSVTVNNPSVCAGLSATLTANAVSPDPVSYTWTVPSGVTNPGNVATFNTTTAGTYAVTATNIVTNCISPSANSLVTINALPNASITSNNGPICAGSTGTFNLTGTSGATVAYSLNGGPSSTILLTGGNATISVPAATADQTLAISNVDNGTCAQSLTQTSTLLVNSLRTPTFNPWGPYCLNDIVPTVTLPTTSIEGYTGLWNPSSVSTANVGTIVHTFTPDNPAQCAQPITMNVVVHPLPANVTAGPSATITQGASVTLQGAGTGNYSWTPITDLSNPSVANPVANPRATTIYTLTVENSFGCKTSDSLIITVVDNCVEPSKVFTPNHDGLYDYWIAYTGSCVRMVEANVYDRNGSLVYHASDYKNNWDGTRNRKTLPDATYYYVLKITDINGLTYIRKGSVTIIR